MKNKSTPEQKSKPVQKANQKTGSTNSSKTISADATKSLNNIWWLIGAAILLTLIAYLPAFHAGYVNWDDDDYVLKNMLIRNLSDLKSLITTAVQGNYHPLTMISLAMNYSNSELEPFAYHATNIILHLINVFLVFRLCYRLSNENSFIAFTTALLFGLHPMHVESVAWVSERKDVLYSFFFLLGLISYLKYVDGKNDETIKSKSGLAFVLSLLWLLLSLASKPAAVIFPLVLIAIDFLRRRPLNAKVMMEKIPFFILALIFGLLTMHAQQTIGATGIENFYSFSHKMFFGFYGYMMYFVKLILPINLVAFYPFPAINASLAPEYFLSPLFFIATLVLCIKTWKIHREITFGFAFYFINLILILQFYTVGSAIIADRYSYIPYIGLFYIVGWALDKWQDKIPVKPMYLVVALGIVYAGLTYKQSATWESSATLWQHAIDHNPSFKAYTLRAMPLRKEGKLDQALENYNMALKLNQADQDTWVNRGNIYADKHMNSLAFKDYNKALSIKPDFMMALKNRASLYASEGNFEMAMVDLNQILNKQPDNYEAMKVRGQVYFSTKQFDKAIPDFEKSLPSSDNPADLYEFIGICYLNLGKFDLSLQALNKSIQINPKAETYLNRSYTFNALGKMNEARADAQAAMKGGMKLPEEYIKHVGL